jgi:hypothetical protein
VSGSFAEAKIIQTEILLGDLEALPLDAQPEATPSIDDMPNPFIRDPDLADRYLRELGPKDRVEHLMLHQRNTRRPRWDDYVSYANARAHKAAQASAIDCVPRVAIFGKSDGLSHKERGRTIEDCLRAKRPFVVVDAISGVGNFLAVHGDALWASTAIAVLDLEDIASAVASGPATAVTSRGRGMLSLGANPWIPITEISHTPELITSCIVPLGRASHRLSFLQLLAAPELDSIYGLSGNAMILNGVVLGGTGAAFQPPCYAWDACVAPIASAAGRTVARIDTQEFLGTDQLHSQLLSSAVNGERLPGLVIARHEVAARQLVRRVRKHPA